MNKEYRINIWRAGYIIAMVAVPALLGLLGFGLYSTFRANAPTIFIYVGGGCLFAALVFFYITFFYYNKLRISIDGDDIVYKMPDKTISFNIKDVCEIKRDFSGAGVGYYIFFYDTKQRKRHIKFTQDLEDSEELVDYIERKSKVKMRQEGTVEIKDTDKPAVKVLKIAYNIIITLIILGLLVVWPFIHAWNHK